MPPRQIAPYGSWRSPITPYMLVADAVRLHEVRFDGEDTYWIEGRPREGGRNVIVRRDASGEPADIIPPEFNARDRVHEYGGGSYVVDAGTLYFSSFDDNRVYRQQSGEEPRPITPGGDLRYADLVVDRAHRRLLCVREDHSDPEGEAVNTLVAVDLEAGGEGEILASGNDFYSTPRPSPDGTRLAWLTWNHPNMPWDATELWLADVGENGRLERARRVAGGETESVFQPEWVPDGTLYLVSDRTGWWNLYRLRGETVEAVTAESAELGMPQWSFGMSTYGFADEARAYCIVNRSGDEYIAILDTGTGELKRVATPYVALAEIRVAPDRIAVIGSSATQPGEIAELDLSRNSWSVLRRSDAVPFGEEYISRPQAIEFPTENNVTAHAFYYLPHNPDFMAPEDDLPPLIVSIHGGPTGFSDAGLQLDKVQFWTSRGFAVVDVNYGGSAGFGRGYRQRLKGQWGVVDVDDCVNAARYLVERGLADPKRLIIHGGSAGGYTTLLALAQRDVFSAGCSYYGIARLEGFADDTHKFESRYLDFLVGPLPARRDLYRERSAINYADNISCPVIFFQGEEDRVVPPNQTSLMVEALNRNGVPNAAIYFPGEGHGFRKAENIVRMYEAELYFYSRVFGFELPEPVEPVKTTNL